MTLETIKDNLNEMAIFHSEAAIAGKPTVIGYEKKFKWAWMATQLNTFVVASDFGSEEITVAVIEKHLAQSFEIAKKYYSGWPRGLQSGMGAITILISDNVKAEAKEYCEKLLSGKKWAGFSIPIVHNAKTGETFQFLKNPMWGRIYYPHFRQLIDGLK